MADLPRGGFVDLCFGLLGFAALVAMLLFTLAVLSLFRAGGPAFAAG